MIDLLATLETSTGDRIELRGDTSEERVAYEADTIVTIVSAMAHYGDIDLPVESHDLPCTLLPGESLFLCRALAPL